MLYLQYNIPRNLIPIIKAPILSFLVPVAFKECVREADRDHVDGVHEGDDDDSDDEDETG